VSDTTRAARRSVGGSIDSRNGGVANEETL
jgi:hypothetical protein